MQTASYLIILVALMSFMVFEENADTALRSAALPAGEADVLIHEHRRAVGTAIQSEGSSVPELPEPISSRVHTSAEMMADGGVAVATRIAASDLPEGPVGERFRSRLAAWAVSDTERRTLSGQVEGGRFIGESEQIDVGADTGPEVGFGLVTIIPRT